MPDCPIGMNYTLTDVSKPLQFLTAEKYAKYQESPVRGQCTWYASAKLAAIFPGFSFLTGLVPCNQQHCFCLGLF